MTLFQATAPVCVLATGKMPSSAKLGPAFTMHDLPVTEPVVAPDIAPHVRAIAAAGPRRITDGLMAQLPHLQIVANFGVGYDRVDVEAATRRGIVVTNTPDVLTDEVADFTLGLLISTTRRIVAADSFIRSGAWAAGASFPLSPSLRGRRIGLVGMGRIGTAIGQRCAAMGLDVAYHSRTAKRDIPFEYFASPVDLAKAVQVLIVVVPGGPETDKMIDAEVIDALGSDGILINVARGSVVDEPALISALREGRLLAAGLDVFPDEPRVSPELISLPNLVLCPHMGSASITTRQAMGDLVLANIRNWFEGKGALNPVNQSQPAITNSQAGIRATSALGSSST